MNYRKLDTLIAERIMKWADTHPGAFGDGGLYVSKPLSPGHGIHTVVPFRPSKHMTDAWQVSEKMALSQGYDNPGFEWLGPSYKAENHYIGVEHPLGTTCWYVICCHDGLAECTAAKTPMMAICLAALKAYGVDTSEFEGE